MREIQPVLQRRTIRQGLSKSRYTWGAGGRKWLSVPRRGTQVAICFTTASAAVRYPNNTCPHPAEMSDAYKALGKPVDPDS